MKKHFLLGFLVFVSLFIFTGCIDFLEDITYHKDGSGKYQFTMDASAIKELMDGFGDSSDKPEGMGDLGEMTKGFDEVKTKLNGLAGITNFIQIEDTINYVFGFSFDFDDLTALNLAMQQQEVDEANKNKIFFTGKKRHLVRTNTGGLAELFKKEMAGDLGDENSEMIKSMFGDMKLRSVYHFDRKVKSSSNVNSFISENKKEVTLDYYFFKPEMNKGNEGVGSTFKLRYW